MKIIKRISIFFLTFLLVGCGKVDNSAEQTEAVEPIVTQAALEAALGTNVRVDMGGDIQLKSGVVMNNNMLVGNGYQLVGTTYDENNAKTRASIFMVGGTIENIVLTNAYCSISTTSTYRVLFDIRLDNVVSDGRGSPLYIGHGDNLHKLDAFNCEFYGKTVYSRIAEAYFADCTFGFNSNGSQGSIWAYRDTRFSNCRFEGLGDTKFQLVIPKEENSREVILENCYVGDTLITEDNIGQLLQINNQGNNTIRVANG